MDTRPAVRNYNVKKTIDEAYSYRNPLIREGQIAGCLIDPEAR